RENGLEKKIKIYPEFQGEKKSEFFRDVDVISVPVNKRDGYGLYILEANAAGIPVVQPATGAFPEILETTGGGIIYAPDTIEALADSVTEILSDRNKLREYSEEGYRRVREKLSLEKMSAGLSEVYNKTIKHDASSE
ncbi:MAG: glycosyltransferase family 4 protein, partial [Bacteroidales bacterium]|nr:glycosyltransferase family 4 protein [Bacteroidales bacterium]